MTAVVSRPRRRTWWQLVGYLARRATVAELRGYQSIYRFVCRRPKVPVGSVGFSYHQPIFAVLVVIIAVSAVELVVVDLIVRRWPSVRVLLLVLSLWGLVWMFGLLLGMLTRPHAVGPDGVRVRYGAEVDLPFGWGDITSVRRSKRTQQKAAKVTVDQNGDATLHMRIGDLTNIELELERPTRLRLPHGFETVHKVALYVDDPQAFMSEVRNHIG